LLFEASKHSEYQHLVDDAVQYGKQHGSSIEEKIEKSMDKLAVNFGIEILKIVPGRVSTEIDARHSFDIEKNIRKGRELIELYKQAGIDKDRVLLKIASTWEGLQAAKQLESEGLHVNMTLMFGTIQAAVAGENGVTLISPFAGRITDFFKQKEGRKDNYPAEEDPGVKSVREIYTYMKKFNYKTVVMGASFRTKEQVLALAGCDLLTVSPQLLEELMSDHESNVERKLSTELSKKDEIVKKLETDEKSFRWLMNEDEMAGFKLAEGIRKFAADIVKLENEIKKKIGS